MTRAMDLGASFSGNGVGLGAGRMRRGFCALGGVTFGAGQGLGSGKTALTEYQPFVSNTLGKSLSREVV